MKKALFPLIAVALVLGLALVPSLGSIILPAGSALAQEDDPEVCLVGYGPGKLADLEPQPPYSNWTRLALFYLTVDGELEEGWCIEADLPISPAVCFNATLSDAPRVSPWCEIAYIVTNNSPSTNNSAAAMQLAIWKYLEGGRGSVNCTNDADLENAALQMYDAALGKSVIDCNSTLELKADGEATKDNGVASQDFTATVTDSGCLEGIAIEFSTDKGSFSPPNGAPVTSTTVLTDTNGKGSVTLYWDASEVTLTAHTEGNWPVKIIPDPEEEEIQETISMSRPCELTDRVMVGPRTVEVGGEIVHELGLAALFLIGGITWLALRRRST